MKEYFYNLLGALSGRNPFLEECENLKDKLSKARENMSELNEQYYKILEKLEHEKKQVASLQQLVENLRDRIADKETVISQQQRDYRERMDRMQNEFQHRIDKYMKEIDALTASQARRKKMK